MDRAYKLELLLRKALGCDRPEQLLTFGGIVHAGCLKNQGEFYVGGILALASLYSKATLTECHNIDNLVEALSFYRESKLDDISENEYNNIFEKLSMLVNKIRTEE